MDQGLVVAILVGVIVLLVGLLTLLVVAAVLLALANRRAEAAARERARPKERPRKVRTAPSPGPTAPAASPPPGMAFASPTSADEAATEVMSARHLAALFESEENTGTTEVRGLLGDDGHLQLEDTEETTELGRDDSAKASAKKN